MSIDFCKRYKGEGKSRLSNAKRTHLGGLFNFMRHNIQQIGIWIQRLWKGKGQMSNWRAAINAPAHEKVFAPFWVCRTLLLHECRSLLCGCFSPSLLGPTNRGLNTAAQELSWRHPGSHRKSHYLWRARPTVLKRQPCYGTGSRWWKGISPVFVITVGVEIRSIRCTNRKHQQHLLATSENGSLREPSSVIFVGALLCLESSQYLISKILQQIRKKVDLFPTTASACRLFSFRRLLSYPCVCLCTLLNIYE